MPVTFNNICPHCLILTAVKDSSDDEYKKAYNRLEKRYLHEINYFLEKFDNRYAIILEGSEDLLPHGTQARVLNTTYDKFKKIPEMIAHLKENGRIPLSKKQVENLSANTHYVDNLMRSISFEIGGAHILRTSYLSESELEIRFIREYTNDPQALRRANLMNKYLTCLVPFLEDVKPKTLLKLREDEQEHFIVFRQAITKAIDEYKIIGSSFSARDAQALYSDIIQPQLAKLEIKVKNAKKHYIKSSIKPLASWIGAISVGFFTGLVTQNLIAGSAAFSAVKGGAEYIEKILAKKDTESTIQNEEIYYLWRIKKLVN